MAGDGDQKAFWTTLPGFMTGTAAMITALVSVLTVMGGKGRSSEAPGQRHTVAPVHAMPLVPGTASVPAAGSPCQRITGEWNWFTGGVTRFMPDGSLEWRRQPEDAMPTALGRWTCDNNTQQFTLAWAHGLTDSIALSQDGRSVDGQNQQNGIRVTGTRR
jgi:hypothetical protein